MPRQDQEFEYQAVAKGGKPTEDMEKITKVIATLKPSTAGTATKLGNQLEAVLKQKEDIDAKLATLKENIRSFIGEVFNAEDEMWTRVVETAKVIMSMSKATTRANFNKDKFLQSISKEFPDFAKRFNDLVKECISISDVASKLDVELKTESVGQVFKKMLGNLKSEIAKVVKNVKMFLTGYDRKLAHWKAELEKNTEKQEPIQEKPVEQVETEDKNERLELFKKYINEANRWL